MLDPVTIPCDAMTPSDRVPRKPVTNANLLVDAGLGAAARTCLAGGQQGSGIPGQGGPG